MMTNLEISWFEFIELLPGMRIELNNEKKTFKIVHLRVLPFQKSPKTKK